MSLRSFARFASSLASLLLLVGLAARPLAAQSTVDWITGSVVDGTGKPVIGATIEAYSIELDVTKKATANDKGRFSIPFNDGGGRYRVTVRAIGKTPFITNVSRQEDDDRIVLNVKLGDRPQVLTDIRTQTVRAQGDQNERPTPGSTERNVDAGQMARLPIDASDLAALAQLVPGVIVTAGSDSTATTFQVAGQNGAANNIVVDGTSNGGALPADGIRGTRVITNTFDVSRGQFSGGQVSATTRGGSNRQQGSISGNFRDRNLAFGSATDNVFTSGQTSQQVGAGFGGALRKDKLFLFGSFNVNRAVNPMASLDRADATTLLRLGASPDSVARFISLVGATGLTSRVGTVDPNRTQDRFSGSLRFDWNVADRQILTVRGDLNTTTSDPTRVGQTQLPQVGGNQSNNGGGVQVSLVSRPTVDLSNEFRAYGSISNAESTPFLYVPVGRVQNQSTLDDGGIATTSFGFGGNSGLPTTNKTKSLELTNTISYFAAGGAHRFQLGALLNMQSFTANNTNNQYGTYSYNSLADFAANVPATFSRTLQPVVRDGSSLNSALFLSDVWRKGPNLQFTIGGRLEYSSSAAPRRGTPMRKRSSASGPTCSRPRPTSPRASASRGRSRRPSSRASASAASRRRPSCSVAASVSSAARCRAPCRARRRRRPASAPPRRSSSASARRCRSRTGTTSRPTRRRFRRSASTTRTPRSSRVARRSPRMTRATAPRRPSAPTSARRAASPRCSR